MFCLNVNRNLWLRLEWFTSGLKTSHSIKHNSIKSNSLCFKCQALLVFQLFALVIPNTVSSLTLYRFNVNQLVQG